MASGPAASTGLAVSFGPFRLLPAQQLLLEGESPVRLGSRAFEILTALVERPGEVVAKGELIERVWPDTFIDENTLRVHVAGLRRALGDGQPGRRYLASVPGRGYRFVAPIDRSQPEELPPHTAGTPPPHNLPISRSRVIGRKGAIDALCLQVLRQLLTTIVGAGGIGKTTVAVAVAEALLSHYPDGIRFVDLAPIEDPQFVSNSLGGVLGLAIHPESAVPRLLEFLNDKRMLIVLDSCEHVVETIAPLIEQLLAGAPGVRVLATSREPLRLGDERVHRLQPLEIPLEPSKLSAAEALAFPSVQLFVERAAGNLEEFELGDAEAPIVSDICSKLGGVALAIELAAARVDAFGIHQLAALLDDQFRILRQGKRTAPPRHQSLAAALDWSYEFLPEAERTVLCRLSVFVGAFTLESAIAVAEDKDTDVIDSVANLVAKSLISADVGGPVVLYRLLDTTRDYARQKSIERDEFRDCVRRYALHLLDWLKSVEADSKTKTSAEWLVEYGRKTDDLRAALNWAFSPDGDLSIGVGLTAASNALWRAIGTAGESLEEIERALAGPISRSALTARVVGGALEMTRGPLPSIRKAFAEAVAVAEKTGDLTGRIDVLLHLSVNNLYAGNYGEAAAIAETCCAGNTDSDDVGHSLMAAGVAAPAYLCFGDFTNAQRHIDSILSQDHSSRHYWFFGYRLGAQTALANLQWLRGFPDQAIRSAEIAIEQSEENGNPIVRANVLAEGACPIALYRGDLATADRWIATLLDLSVNNALAVRNACGLSLRGIFLAARGDKAGLSLLENSLDTLREANFAFLRTIPTSVFAQRLAEAGEATNARRVIDDLIEQAKRNAERWCMAELLRIKGEIVRLDLAQSVEKEAEDYFLQALDWARKQEALSWELRAATSLAKLWRHDDKTVKARELLSGVYGRFTEGFDTADLRTARTLIGELK